MRSGSKRYKRILSLILAGLLCFAVSACNGSGKTSESESSSQGLSVGFGKADITPYDPVNLGSYGDTATRISQGYIEPLYAITVAITDENDETLLLIVTDLSWGYYVQTEEVRQIVEKDYGIPGDHVMLGGTHNHNAPSYTYKSDMVASYMNYWKESVKSSIAQALADRKPAKMEIGRTKSEGLNFVRRYWLEDGTILTDKDNTSKKIVSHETDPDEEIQMLKFSREGGKDVLIANWQAHCALQGDTLNATSDWVGVFRETVEEELNVNCIYFQGAAGNLNPVSRIKEENRTKIPREHGELLASYVINAWQEAGTFKAIATGPIQVRKNLYSNLYRDDLDEKTKSIPHELDTIAFGDASIVTLPTEMFDTSAKQIKDGTPFEMTLIMGYTNGNHSYLPDKEAFSHGGYETTNTVFKPGAAEEIVDIYLNNLTEMHK